MKLRPQLTRSFELLDIERSGDGRTVTAYAATFGDPYEVRDQFGHYFESINRSAFNRTISRGINAVSVFYNHGRTIDGRSSDRYSMPIGTPQEIKADGRGLLTVTRYAATETADEVLSLIDSGAIRAQSFRGPIYEDAAPRPHASGLQLVERMQLGLIEYGPTPIPVNQGAGMVSVRSTSDLLTVDPSELTDEERASLLAALQDLAPLPAPGDAGTADGSADEAPPHPVDPASDPIHLAQAQRRRRAA